ncbi:hypothetical protein D3C85_1321540 [compost metagenome]
MNILFASSINDQTDVIDFRIVTGYVDNSVRGSGAISRRINCNRWFRIGSREIRQVYWKKGTDEGKDDNKFHELGD